MRIALVAQGGFDRSGRDRVVPALLWLVERLARRHEIHVFALKHYPELRTYPLLGASVHDLGGLGRATGFGLLRAWPALVGSLRSFGRFDALHGYMGPPAALAAVAGRRLGVPVVATLDGGELVALPEIGYGLGASWRGRLIVGTLRRLATRVTVCTAFMARLARSRGIDSEEIPLGVDAGTFSPAGQPPSGPPWRLLHVASLNRVKDQETLLQALRRVVDRRNEVHLDLVGVDTLAGAIQRRAAELGLGPHVTFHGLKAADEMPPFYRAAHLLVLSSRHEAAGVAVLEAAACGVPSVGTAVGYLADWAPEAASAVPVGDAAALAAAILSLLGDAEQRRLLGLAARQRARAFDADWSAARFEGLYREMARARTTSAAG